MMHKWMECKVGYEKTLENGMSKKVIEPYLLSALSFTEAEARIIEKIAPFITGEFTVVAIKRESYSEVFLGDGGYFFKCRVVFITLDEKSGKERKTKCNMLVQADDLQQAKDKFVQNMKGTMADYRLEKVEETAIVDVYPYSAKEASNK